jgi:hypothetical protein
VPYRCYLFFAKRDPGHLASTIRVSMYIANLYVFSSNDSIRAFISLHMGG